MTWTRTTVAVARVVCVKTGTCPPGQRSMRALGVGDGCTSGCGGWDVVAVPLRGLTVDLGLQIVWDRMNWA